MFSGLTCIVPGFQYGAEKRSRRENPVKKLEPKKPDALAS